MKALERATLLCLLCAMPALGHATHNRAGEIIYCHLSGNTYQVEIITHTKSSSPADRPELEIQWGDGTSDTLPRASETPLGNDSKRNTYLGTHTYIGPGVYLLQFEDPNRNGGVLNIPNSVQEPFCVQSQLIISPFGGQNCSVRFLNSPLQDACFQKPWYHNPAAYDPDGDSLSFELIACHGMNCDPIVGYSFPDGIVPGPGNQFDIDPVTGTISWISAQLNGEYNFAFKVTEWRRVNGILTMMGWVLRDMQLNVLPCDNEPPVISAINDTCVVAGSFLSFPVTASDPDPGDLVSMNALGEPFILSNAATFVSPNLGNPVTGTFSWTPSCDEVRLQPYQVIFQAIDNNGSVPLVDVEEMTIRVVAPAPENPLAEPDVTSIELSWDASICTNATGYKIYRREGFFGFVPGNCETGVPAYTGYSLIGTTPDWATTTYSDNDGVMFGTEYCYMIVACFADGAQSYASEEVCATLRREAPILKNVSILTTDLIVGDDSVRWTNATELDTVQYPGPYQFQLFRGVSPGPATSLIHTSSSHPFLAHPDTDYVDMGLDTRTAGYTYRVELHGPNGFISTSTPASSQFLSIDPNDEVLLLEWTDDVPWNNTSYQVFRFDGSQFVQIAVTNTNSYLDTGLVNGQEYCYYIRSTGSYADPSIEAPLWNDSQEACGTPVDLTPPCPPDLAIDNDCEGLLNTLTWNDPNNTCSDDNAGYNIYFTPFQDSTLVLIASINSALDTIFEHVNGMSVAGCYTVTAIDSVGNESAMSNTVCGENCPIYELPNVFTPNGDGSNDTFRPFPYRGVERIELQIFNRWGQVVFTSEDPDIGWDGTHQSEGTRVPEGVYFYVCQVYYLSLLGEEQITLTGYTHLLSGSNKRIN